jgi:site-specific recombinase XerD
MKNGTESSLPVTPNRSNPSDGYPSAGISVISSSDPQVLQILDLVINGLTSEHSRRVYSTALFEFLTWYDEKGKPGINKATIQAYKSRLQSRNLAPSTINLKLSAVRKLIQEISDNGLMDPLMAATITGVKGIKSSGVRSGNWLTREQAQALINAPDIRTFSGIRDRAVLAVMIGCGLRRSEVSRLTYAHIQQREGRWAVVDLVGKGKRVRTVPMPPWSKVALDVWVRQLEARIGHFSTDQRVFRAINKADRLSGVRKASDFSRSDGFMSDQAIADVVKLYCEQLGYTNVAAHDLRRTFAKLARKGGAEIDQIQLSLGHASIQTTERYLGTQQDMNDAPADRLGLELKK